MILGSESLSRNSPPIGVLLKAVKCPTCGETDRTKFYVNKKGYKASSICRECHKKKCLERWHSQTMIEKHATRVKKLYGIEPEQYKQMHVDQDGKCAICGVEPKTKRGLHIDHCHDTGVIRGLLCGGCNTGIGLLQENPEIMTKAIEYLLRSK
jgi:hypothetical protein